MDLFDYMREQNKETSGPLASRMRPTTLDEVVGQQHIVGKDKLLYRAIKADKLSSIIFYGPPGTGKTTLAKVIAHTTSAEFMQINATSAGKKDMEEVVKQAQNALGMYGRKTILFIDEIHRFNKAQQDAFLPYVEKGSIILIGATTENPYFEVNNALLSRSRIFELKPLEKQDIRELVLRAVYDEKNGKVIVRVRLSPNAAALKVNGIFTDAGGEEYLKISVISVPEKGKANKELVNLLSGRLKIAKSDIVIVSGETDRYKRLEVSGETDMIISRLNELAG